MKAKRAKPPVPEVAKPEELQAPGERVAKPAGAKLLAYVAFPLFLVAIFLLLWIFRDQFYRIFSSAESVRDWVLGWGLVAPLVFMALQFIQVVLFVIPGEVTQVAGGYLFGMWLGTLYSLIGILIGSTVNFYLGRTLGVPFVEAIFGAERLKRFGTILSSKRATTAFFLLFAIPGIPKDALSYVAGLSSLRFGWFLLVSTVGRLPGILGSSAIGGAVARQMWLTVGFVVLAATILLVLGLLYREQLHRFVERVVTKKNPQEPDESRRE